MIHVVVIGFSLLTLISVLLLVRVEREAARAPLCSLLRECLTPLQVAGASADLVRRVREACG